LIEEFGEIIQNEGVFGLYSGSCIFEESGTCRLDLNLCDSVHQSGLSAALAGIVATNGIYYYWYSFFESFLRKLNNDKQLGMLGYTFVAADAGTRTH